MPSHVADEWAAFLAAEPRGESRADWHAAQSSWATFESQRVKGTPLAVGDHLLEFDSASSTADSEGARCNEAAMRAFFARRQRK